MPHIAIQLSGPRDAQRQQQISRAVSQLTQSILHKRAEVIAITFEQIADEDWWIGGQTLAEFFFRNAEIVFAAHVCALNGRRSR